MHVEAKLRCEFKDEIVEVVTQDGALAVKLPSAATARRLVRLGATHFGRRGLATRIRQLAERLDQRIVVLVRGRTLLIIGRQDAHPFWRLLGLPVLEFHPMRLLAERV